MWNLQRNDTNELIYKTETNSQTWRKNLGFPKGKNGGEGIVREFRINIGTLLYLKWITNKDLPLAQGTLLSVMWQPGWEGV